MKTLAIRVSDEDHVLFAAVAVREDMPLSALIRRQLRALARGHGLLQDSPPPAAEPSAPKIEWRPIPTGTNVWAYEIHARRRGGESFADIATSYGVDVGLIKAKDKFAEEQIAAGYTKPIEYTPQPRTKAPAPDNQHELVYDPADPENPTEEEQAINAEIARRKLEAMGFKL